MPDCKKQLESMGADYVPRTCPKCKLGPCLDPMYARHSWKYAALVERSIYIPGDERSRTHPGHGYPESTEIVTDFKEFKDKDDMIKWVQNQEVRTIYKPKYRLIKYQDLKVKTSVEVEVS